MKYREFPYMQFVKRLEHEIVGESGYISLSANQPPEPSLTDLGIDLTQADFSWPSPYTPATIKNALAQHYGVQPSQVMTVVGGSSFANFLAASFLVNPGDEVIVEDPVYDALTGVAEILGAKVVFYPRHHETQYDIDPAGLARLITSRTKLIFLTHPHNPSGTALPEQRLRDLGVLSEETGVPVLIDEVYLDHVPQRKAAPFYGSRLIHTGSLTKVYGIASWRFGWIIADPDFVRRCEYFHDLLCVSPPPPINWLAAQLLPNLGRLRTDVWGAYRRGAEQVDAFVEDCGLWWVKPAHCPFGFIRLPAGMDDRRLSHWLRTEHKVLVAAGHFFNRSGWIRVGWFPSEDQVARGLAALREGLDHLT